MIGGSLDVVGLQHGCQLLHLLARQAVHDAALAGVLLDEADNLLVDILRFLAHFIVEVRTIERTLELYSVHNAQTLLDVRAHLVGGRGRQGYYRRIANLIDRGAYVAVFRTKVVTPLRYTVGLVDGIERNLHATQEFHVLILIERLRSHVEQLRLALLHVVHHLLDGSLVQRGIQIVGHALLLAQAVDHIHLVLHQRNERRDDDGRAFHDERRQLIAQTLAAAGRHQHERVVAGQQITYDGFLIALELVKAEVVLQLGCQVLLLICHRVFRYYGLIDSILSGGEPCLSASERSQASPRKSSSCATASRTSHPSSWLQR